MILKDYVVGELDNVNTIELQLLKLVALDGLKSTLIKNIRREYNRINIKIETVESIDEYEELVASSRGLNEIIKSAKESGYILAKRDDNGKIVIDTNQSKLAKEAGKVLIKRIDGNLNSFPFHLASSIRAELKFLKHWIPDIQRLAYLPYDSSFFVD